MNRWYSGVLVAIVMASGSACSGGSSGPSAGGSSGGSSGSSAGPTGTGSSEIICDALSSTTLPNCYFVKGLASGDVAAATAACTSDMGTVVSSCPTSGLDGCCTVPASGPGTNTIEKCYYGASGATLEQLCGDVGGTWSTTP